MSISILVCQILPFCMLLLSIFLVRKGSLRQAIGASACQILLLLFEGFSHCAVFGLTALCFEPLLADVVCNCRPAESCQSIDRLWNFFFSCSLSMLCSKICNCSRSLPIYWVNYVYFESPTTSRQAPMKICTNFHTSE